MIDLTEIANNNSDRKGHITDRDGNFKTPPNQFLDYLDDMSETHRCVFIANEFLKIEHRDCVEGLVQDVLQTLVDNFNLNETELEYVVETSLHNLEFEGVA